MIFPLSCLYFIYWIHITINLVIHKNWINIIKDVSSILTLKFVIILFGWEEFDNLELSLDEDWNLGKGCGACPNSCQSLLLTSSGVRTSENGLLEASDLSLLSLEALLNLFPCNAILWMTLRAVVLFDVSEVSSWLSLYRAKISKKFILKTKLKSSLIFYQVNLVLVFEFAL